MHHGHHPVRSDRGSRPAAGASNTGSGSPVFAWANSPHGPIVGAGASLVNISLGKFAREGQDTVPGVPGRYLDIASELRARIHAGEWAPGMNLPRMTDLAREYDVNRDTLAR